MKLRNELTTYRADDRYTKRAYTLVEGTDNSTDYVVLGTYPAYFSIHLEYEVQLPISKKAQVGEITVMTNGTTAWIEAHEYDGEIAGISFDADLNGSDIRLAVIKSAVGEITKFYYQIDRSSLSEADVTITTIPFQRTTRDMDIYVATTGDDVNGDGTSGNPYATLDRAVEAVPHYIDHIVTIFMSSGEYTSWPRYIYKSTSTNGEFRIQALDPSKVISGPYTVTGKTTVGTRAVEYEVAGAPWSEKELWGKFILPLDGTYKDYEQVASYNGTNKVIVASPFYSMSIGDTFNVVDCPVKITTPNRNQKITIDNSADDSRNYTDLASFFISGIHLEMTHASTLTNLVVQGPMAFCLSSAKITGGTIDTRDRVTLVTMPKFYSSLFRAIDRVWFISRFFISAYTAPPTNNDIYTFINSGRLMLVGLGVVDGKLATGSGVALRVFYSTVGSIRSTGDYVEAVEASFLDSYGDPNIRVSGADCYFDKVDLGTFSVADAISLRNSNAIIMDSRSINVDDYAVRMEPGSSAIFSGTSNLSGTTGDVVLSNGETRLFPADDEGINNDVEINKYSALRTSADMDIYVNAATGDDTTGDGTSVNPFATITKAHSVVPKEINHVVHIRVASGNYTDWPDNIDHVYGNGGFLSFDSTSELQDVSGTLTVDAAGPTIIKTNVIADIPIVGGGLVPDEYRGKMIKFLTGTRSGQLGVVLSNTANSIRIIYNYTTVSAGDTLKIIEPGVNVTYGKPGNISSNSRSTVSHFGIFGIKFNLTEKIVFDSIRVTLAASEFNGPLNFQNASTDLGLYKSEVSPASVMDDPDLIDNFSGLSVLSGSSGYTSALGESVLVGLCVFDRGIDCIYGGNVVQLTAICNSDNGYGLDLYLATGNTKVGQVYIEAKSNNHGIRLPDVSGARIQDVYIESGNAGIRLWPGIVGVVITGLTGNDSNVSNAISMGQGSHAVVNSATCTLVGSGGAGSAIKWESGYPDSGYPINGESVSDEIGTTVVDYSSTSLTSYYGKDKTIKDIDIYVNQSTGDDTTGTGQVGSPFATLSRAEEVIPREIRHKVNVFVSSGIHTDCPYSFVHEIYEDGQLTIQGQGSPSVYAGPFTITGFTDIVADGETVGHDVGVTGAGWTKDDFVGKFLRPTSGANSGRYYALHSNDADRITLGKISASLQFAVGDTFEIVELPVEIQCGHSIKFQVENRFDGSFFSDVRFAITGIYFNTIDPGSEYPRIGFTGSKSSIYLNACKFKSIQCYTTGYVEICNGMLTFPGEIANTDMVTTGFSYTNHLPYAIFTDTEDAPTSWKRSFDVFNGSCSISNIEIMGGIWCSNSAHLGAFNLSASGVEGYNGCNIIIYNSYFGRCLEDVFYCKGITGYFQNVYIRDSSKSILYAERSNVRLIDLGGEPVNVTQYGIRLGVIASVNIRAGLVSGSLGDIFTVIGSSVVAYPSAGSGISDGAGSFVVNK